MSNKIARATAVGAMTNKAILAPFGIAGFIARLSDSRADHMAHNDKPRIVGVPASVQGRGASAHRSHYHPNISNWFTLLVRRRTERDVHRRCLVLAAPHLKEIVPLVARRSSRTVCRRNAQTGDYSDANGSRSFGRNTARTSSYRGRGAAGKQERGGTLVVGRRQSSRGGIARSSTPPERRDRSVMPPCVNRRRSWRSFRRWLKPIAKSFGYGANNLLGGQLRVT
jgi:hypothetical protein